MVGDARKRAYVHLALTIARVLGVGEMALSLAARRD
jgi:hypothetical protein